MNRLLSQTDSIKEPATLTSRMPHGSGLPTDILTVDAPQNKGIPEWVQDRRQGNDAHPGSVWIVVGDPMGLSDLLIDDRHPIDPPDPPPVREVPTLEFLPEQVRPGGFFDRDWSKLFELSYCPQDNSIEGEVQGGIDRRGKAQGRPLKELPRETTPPYGKKNTLLLLDE
ncbi:MAG: hypothetical protein SWQ30_04845 [Thermodesulfobacteriota bacterium]|nr:hypothetical protein [Thermodesulfobacteriota bacterium]